jgi:DNA-binding response OmpR family regulator
MPKLTGIDLIRRSRPTHPSLPVILISGDLPKTAPNFATLMNPGVAMQKPFSMAQLLGQVRALLVSAG